MKTQVSKIFIALVLLSGTLYVSSCQQDEAKIAPAVTTGTVTNLTKGSATIGGNVTSDGRATVTARGIVWATSENPTITNDKTTNGTGTGAFSGDLAGLTANTLYYARAYATNSQGTTYGSQISFTTSDLAQVTTGAASNIAKTTASVAGEVTSDGNATVTERGIVWSVNHNPTTADSKVSSGTGKGTFSGDLTGLTGNTTYYARAFATNGDGTNYGAEVTILTLDNATITTGALSDLTSVTANVAGNVSFDGNTSVTSKGIAWSSNHNPIITDHVVDGGSGTGSFSGSISGLDPNSTYYARAFATNSVGTTYGDEVTITTKDINAGLIANFKFDNNYNDNTGNNNPLVHGANNSFVGDRNNNSFSAIAFDGSSASTISTPSAINFNNSQSISISLWFYPQNNGIYLVASNRFQYYYVGIGNNVETDFVINGPSDSGFSSQNFTSAFLNTWHHFTGTYNGTTMSYYLDGALIKSTSFTLGLNLSTIDFWFGQYSSPNYFVGIMDDVKMFNRSLSADEVKYIYNH